MNYLGFDIGAETIKLAVLNIEKDSINCTCSTVSHNKDLRGKLETILSKLDIDSFAGGGTTGRLGKLLNVEKIPTPKALAEGFLHQNPNVKEATVVTIGAHGFSVLEIRGKNRHVFRENGRCSQGTGNFLRQLTERFGLDVDESDKIAVPVETPAPLSGRCPVILKTDMTHLANKGEDRARILAGLFDAVSENVEVLIKPALAPNDIFMSGGVSRSVRVQNHMRKFADSKNMVFHSPDSDENFLYYEAIGAALEAYRMDLSFPASFTDGHWFDQSEKISFKEVPALAKYLSMVKVVPPEPVILPTQKTNVVLGFDMGSTGSKAIAVDLNSSKIVWEKYCKTEGNPVGAAKYLVEDFIKKTNTLLTVVGVGATGSGREIVGSMMKSCFGEEKVFVLNEIAAHAEGALYYDKEVDTIFEIGGQDAKYIRLSDGEIYDSAMNEACSAGTGSFIEEQGNKFEGITHVTELSELALNAESGISLGQHCSVFMAEVIDQALGEGKKTNSVIAGIYDSIIQNYLNRVKGARSVGNKIFCQGMPFSSKALAASVARQTGRTVVIPPNPGLIGALGISLLTGKNLTLKDNTDLDMSLFVDSQILSRDSFVCKSTSGCGGSGNKCKIDRIKVQVAGDQRNFLWGGSCSLYDKGSKNKKLPDMSPDPFRERKELISEFIKQISIPRGNETVGMTEEFILKGLFPFFGTFIRELGFDPMVISKGNHDHLKRGIEEGNVPMCAPMQIYGGILSELTEKKPDHLFIPMIRDIERTKDEENSTVCPLSQASGDIYSHILKGKNISQIHSPRIDMGKENLKSELFYKSVLRCAKSFGITDKTSIETAYNKGLVAQNNYEKSVRAMGEKALSFASEHNLTTIVVLGRAYTIYNDVLNSNVPRLLRELGAIAIPVECYPVGDDVPIFNEVYWGYSQLNLRAAHEIRRTNGHYSVFCSNYSCGPDSFNLHFYSYIMEGKPYSIIETDGHSGDAGTKTRLEAFLYCVSTDEKSGYNSSSRERKQLKLIELDAPTLADVKRKNDLLLIPRMGENAPLLAASLRGDGFRVEAMKMPDTKALSYGRKHSSGKECLPATVTLGSLLERIENAPDEERFSFFMPTANGPCRFGMYNMFHKLVIKKMGLSDKVSVVSQPDSDYYAGISKGLAIKSFAAFVFGDTLYDALLDVRPVEKIPGESDRIYSKWQKIAVNHLESTPAPMITTALIDAMGSMFGLRDIMKSALNEFAQIKDFTKNLPSVSVVGEIYVRLDPFSNNFIIKKLEERGIKAKFAPFQEWLEYTDYINGVEIKKGRLKTEDSFLSRKISDFIQKNIQMKFYAMGKNALKWPPRTKVHDSISSSTPWIREDLVGEAILTLGGPVHEFSHKVVDGVVSVGPLECMPNKIAEAQFFQVTEKIGLPSLTVALNGEPMNLENLDNFVYEVKKSHKNRISISSAGNIHTNNVAKQ